MSFLTLYGPRVAHPVQPRSGADQEVTEEFQAVFNEREDEVPRRPPEVVYAALSTPDGHRWAQ